MNTSKKTTLNSKITLPMDRSKIDNDLLMDYLNLDGKNEICHIYRIHHERMMNSSNTLDTGRKKTLKIWNIKLLFLSLLNN